MELSIYFYMDIFRNSSAVVSVNDTVTDDNDSATFEDAEDGSGPGGKSLMQNGLQSPDSGIHGDKSATELTV